MTFNLMILPVMVFTPISMSPKSCSKEGRVDGREDGRPLTQARVCLWRESKLKTVFSLILTLGAMMHWSDRVERHLAKNCSSVANSIFTQGLLLSYCFVCSERAIVTGTQNKTKLV